MANKRWRFGRIRNLADVEFALTELEKILDENLFTTDRVVDTEENAEYLTASANDALKAEKVFQSGTNTTFATTASTARVDVADASKTVKGAASFTEGEGIDIVASNGDITISGEDASTTNKGIASFTEGEGIDLTIVSGDVAISGEDASTTNKGIASFTEGEGIDLTITSGDVTIAAEDAATGNRGIIALDEDLGGTASLPNVVGIQSNPVEAGVPTTDDIYRWNGSQFARWSPKYLSASLSANQAGAVADEHVEFDTKGADSGHITLSTGTGQANGIFTIPAGVWLLMAHVRVAFTSSSGVLQLQFRDDADDSAIDLGIRLFARPHTSAADTHSMSVVQAMLVNSVSADVKLDIFSETDLDQLSSTNTGITIFALA